MSFISRLDQIMFKLYAASDRAEQRDFDDLIALQTNAQEIESASLWLLKNAVIPENRPRLIEVVRQLGYGEIADRLPR